MSKLTPEQIMIEACQAAQEASDVELQRKMATGDWWPCGFASVRIKPARGKFVSYLKKCGIGSLHWQSGWDLSSYDISNQPGSWIQNMDIKAAACAAFVKVLQVNGINAVTESRMD